MVITNKEYYEALIKLQTPSLTIKTIRCFIKSKPNFKNAKIDSVKLISSHNVTNPNESFKFAAQINVPGVKNNVNYVAVIFTLDELIYFLQNPEENKE